MNTIQKHNIQLWAEALLYANYRQSKGQLTLKFNNSYYYCCLGVANSIFKFTNRKFIKFIPEHTINRSGNRYALLNLDNRTQLKLASYNDIGYPFKFIAYWLLYWIISENTLHSLNYSEEESDIQWIKYAEEYARLLEDTYKPIYIYNLNKINYCSSCSSKHTDYPDYTLQCNHCKKSLKLLSYYNNVLFYQEL